MRILFVLSSMPIGGLEVFTVNLASRLASKGNEVWILIFKSGQKCVDLLKEANVHLIAADRNSKYNPLFISKIYETLKTVRPHAIVSLSEFAYFFAELMNQVLGLKTPHCIRFAWSRPITRWDKIVSRFLIMFSKLWSAYYIFVSRIQAEHYISAYNLPTRSCHLIYSGIDTDFFHPRFKKRNRTFTVAHVANIRPVKDQMVLFRSLEKLDRMFKKWRLLFVGEDRYGLLSSFKGFLSGKQMLSKVKFMVTHDRSKIRDVLSSSDVFVLTSLSEGLPNAPLEAMSVGIPCVLTNVGGCREILQEGCNGYLINTGDHEALASTLFTLQKNRKSLLRMGRNARRSIISRFSLNSCTDDYLRVLQDISSDR